VSRLAGVPQVCSREFPTPGVALRGSLRVAAWSAAGLQAGLIGPTRLFSARRARFRRAESCSAALRGSGPIHCPAGSAAWRPDRSCSTRSWWRRIR
jgi:hypothetical protein